MKKKWFYSQIIGLLCVGMFSFTASANEKTKTQVPNTVISKAAIEEIVEQATKDVTKKVTKEILKEIRKNKRKAQQQGKGNNDDSAVDDTEQEYFENKIEKLGSGTVGGNYFVLGELVGSIVSHPKGSLPCGEGGTCGVVDTQFLNITSLGSVANIDALKEGTVHSAFVQSDVSYWAYTGTGSFENNGKMDNLRAIASLYPEAVHIVINKNANIKTVADLKGKRVSVGPRSSGTILQSRLILGAYHLSEDDMQTEYLTNEQGITKLQNGELDAMFFSAGAPAPALTLLFNENKDFTLLSLDNTAKKEVFKHGSYFSPFVIEKGVYPNVEDTKTVSVFALWLTTEEVDEDLVYQMTKSLWSEQAKQLFGSSDIGRQVLLDNSLKGIGIPLHKGAKKFYDEIGKRF